MTAGHEYKSVKCLYKKEVVVCYWVDSLSKKP